MQAVTGLGLGGGRPAGEHAQQARARLGDERLDGGGARGADGGDDPAAGCQDVEIFRAGLAHLELGGAVAAPDEVRVRVHEAGHHHAAGGVQRRLVRIAGAQLSGRPDGGDFLVADEHRTFLEDAELAEFAPALRAAG